MEALEAELHVEGSDREFHRQEKPQPTSEKSNEQKNAATQLEGGGDERQETGRRESILGKHFGDARGDTELKPLLVAVYDEDDRHGDAHQGDTPPRVEARDPSHDAPSHRNPLRSTDPEPRGQ